MQTLFKADGQHIDGKRLRTVAPRSRAIRKRSTRIDLSQPYEVGLAAALSLPRGRKRKRRAEHIIKIFRRLYEAANGRQVATVIGRITVAPAVAPWLKDRLLLFNAQDELLDFAADFDRSNIGAAG